jgi:hypothetical protein
MDTQRQHDLRDEGTKVVVQKLGEKQLMFHKYSERGELFSATAGGA